MDRAQKLICSSMSRHLSIRKISSKYIHAFLSNLANRQTDRHGQKHVPAPLSEVIVNLRVYRAMRHGRTGLLGQEERPHHPIAPGPSLAARPGARQVQVTCVGLPVSARHSTVVPRRRPSADFYYWYPPSTPVC